MPRMQSWRKLYRRNDWRLRSSCLISSQLLRTLKELLRLPLNSAKTTTFVKMQSRWMKRSMPKQMSKAFSVCDFFVVYEIKALMTVPSTIPSSTMS